MVDLSKSNRGLLRGQPVQGKEPPTGPGTSPRSSLPIKVMRKAISRNLRRFLAPIATAWVGNLRVLTEQGRKSPFHRSSPRVPEARRITALEIWSVIRLTLPGSFPRLLSPPSLRSSGAIGGPTPYQPLASESSSRVTSLEEIVGFICEYVKPKEGI